MKQLLKIIFYLQIIPLCILHIHAHTKQDDSNVQQLTQYTVETPKEIIDLGTIPEVGIGSSLSFKGISPNGSMLFYTITDRGFNMPLPNSTNGHTLQMFIDPQFSPFIGVIEVSSKKTAKLISVSYLTINGERVSGIPPLDNGKGSKKEVAVDPNYNTIKSNRTGIDCESFDYDKKRDCFWVGEEYGPTVYQFTAKTGNYIKKFSPTQGLPEILNHRQENKGFEALTVMPNGKLLIALEGTLNINGETKNSALFIRLIELDPTTGKTRMFAYPFEQGLYNESMNAKIGDLAAIDDNHFLLIEQGKKDKEKMHNAIYSIDISDATDISDMKLPNGKELEYASAQELTKTTKVKMVKKKLIVDPNAHGWVPEKMEGLAIIDAKRIAIMNDNDFGAYGTLISEGSLDMQDYRIDLDKKILLQNGKASDARIEINPTGEKPQLWIFELSEALF